MHTTTENHRVYGINFKAGKLVKKLVGFKCRHCGQYQAAENGDDAVASQDVDFSEHVTYCSPAHRRAMAGERY